MTEKDVYKKGVALLEEWEDVNYCEHSFKFKDEWLTDKEVVDLLNELAEENEQSKMMIATLRNIILENEDLLKETEELKKENQYIKNTIKDMLNNERTHIGQSVLKQLWEIIQ